MIHHNKRLLIIDDDQEILSLLKALFEPQGYHITLAASAKELIQHLQGGHGFDLLLLDVMLPDGDGIQLCQQIHSMYPNLLIILMTANQSESDRVLGIEFGADDYIQKPFNTRELLARVKAFFRRNLTQSEIKQQLPKAGGRYQFDGWILDTKKHVLTSPEGVIIPLSNGIYELLVLFIQYPDTLLSRDFLIDATNRRKIPFDRSIDLQVSRLRQKLRDNTNKPNLIKTVRSQGYLFTANVTEMNE